MNEKDTSKEFTSDAQSEARLEKIDVKKFAKAFQTQSISSAEMINSEKATAEISSFDEEAETISALDFESFQQNEVDLSEREIDSLIEESFVFKTLFEPKLPALSKENRARLQMQSPTRLYFYWSFKNNPFETLRRIFGAEARNHTLIVKLVNRTQNREEIFPIDVEGSTWFEVDADSSYQTEIGFYAAHQPFVRLMFSNTVVTPRKNPSSRSDFSSDWTVSANKFAQVLDSSGYAKDAVEVALAGDDAEIAETATRNAFTQVFGNQETDFSEAAASEIRFVLLALASGYSPESLRGQISKNLFAKLMENAWQLSAEKALNALQENFGEFVEETFEENFGQAAFGASSINFPQFSKRRILPEFTPISSFR